MNYVFEVIDKTERKIRLTPRQWRETNLKHPSMTAYLEEIKETLVNPDKITDYSLDESVRYYYKSFKNLNTRDRYLLVIVKYLNGDGFVIKSYFVRKIK
ncbi:MAG: hypothetical protein Q8P81_04170 [Nanoarchaeota archaeon]|nr:hypothetical protein [Nanoarchaeota archaeon]